MRQRLHSALISGLGTSKARAVHSMNKGQPKSSDILTALPALTISWSGLGHNMLNVRCTTEILDIVHEQGNSRPVLPEAKHVTEVSASSWDSWEGRAAPHL
jgi:hypothetical protein